SKPRPPRPHPRQRPDRPALDVQATDARHQRLEPLALGPVRPGEEEPIRLRVVGGEVVARPPVPGVDQRLALRERPPRAALPPSRPFVRPPPPPATAPFQ